MSDRIAPESLLSHADFVRRLAWRLLGDEHQAEDVVQQTWLAAMQRPPTQEGGLRSWLGVVARNIALKSRRTDSRRQRNEEAGARTVRVPTPSQVLEREATRQRVVAAVLELDEPYRAVVLLRFFESLPPRDIAASLGVPVETVRTRLKRAFARLRQRLDAEHGGDRRAWAMPLLPLARGAPMAGLEGVLEHSAPRTGGTSIMSTVSGRGMGMGKIVAATVLVAAGAGAVWWVAQPDQGGGPDVAAAPDTDAADVVDAPEEDAERVRTRAPASLTETAAETGPEGRALGPTTIRGRLVDEAGEPFVNAAVVVYPEIQDHRESSKLDGEREREEPLDETDENGYFVLRLPRAEKVMVAARETPAIQPIADPTAWITPPFDGVIVRAKRVPVGTLCVRLNDAATGAPMEHFIVRVAAEGRDDFNLFAESDEATRALRIIGREPGVRRLTVTLTEPALDIAPTRDVVLEPGKRTLVTFEMPDRPEVSGQVFGASGVPVSDAFVYVGDEFRGRRDWARPVNPEHIPDGARTDANGRYTVRGDGGLVTAFHPGHGAATVAVADAGRLSFPARGKIRGRLLGLGGKPATKLGVELDRSDIVTELDDGGRFTFESVAAGARWVSVPKPIRHIIGIQVAPGETVDAEIGGWIEKVEGEMLAGGALAEDLSYGGVVVGMGRGPHSLHECEVNEGRFRLGRILPGRYVLLSRRGKVAIMDIDGPNVRVDAGTATLTVRAAPGTAVYVIPGDPSDHVRLFAPYNAQKVPESGEVTWGPLPAGRYAVGVARRGIKTHVEVGDTGTSVTLD